MSNTETVPAEGVRVGSRRPHRSRVPAAKRLQLEEQTVCVKFVEDEGSETYDIQWVELLSEDNIPFISIEELNSDDSFLAPYLLTNGQTAYAPAVLVTGTEPTEETEETRKKQASKPKKAATRKKKMSPKKDSRERKQSASKKKSSTPKRKAKAVPKLREDTNLSLSKELLKTLNFKTDGSGDTDTEESSSKPSTPKTQFQIAQNVTSPTFLPALTVTDNRIIDVNDSMEDLTTDEPSQKICSGQSASTAKEALHDTTMVQPRLKTTEQQETNTMQTENNTRMQTETNTGMQTETNTGMQAETNSMMHAEANTMMPEKTNSMLLEDAVKSHSVGETLQEVNLMGLDSFLSPNVSPNDSYNHVSHFRRSADRDQQHAHHNLYDRFNTLPLSHPVRRANSQPTTPYSAQWRTPMSPPVYVDEDSVRRANSLPATQYSAQWRMPMSPPVYVDQDSSSVYSDVTRDTYAGSLYSETSVEPPSVVISVQKALEKLTSQLDRLEKKVDKMVPRKSKKRRSVEDSAATPGLGENPQSPPKGCVQQADGAILGDPQSKSSVLIKHVSPTTIADIERDSKVTHPLALAKCLFDVVFEEELTTHPCKVCLSESSDGKKEVLNKDFVDGIRRHVAYKYKFTYGSMEEKKKWAFTLSKLNDRVRYKRKIFKKGESSVNLEQ